MDGGNGCRVGTDADPVTPHVSLPWLTELASSSRASVSSRSKGMRIRTLTAAFAIALVMASCSTGPWRLAVRLDLSSMQPSPMILRVHDEDQSREWLIPVWVEDQPEEVFLDLEPRPSGPIELLEAGTCKVLAIADLPTSGAGVRVDFWEDGEAEKWMLIARVGVVDDVQGPPLESGTYCDETAT